MNTLPSDVQQLLLWWSSGLPGKDSRAFDLLNLCLDARGKPSVKRKAWERAWFSRADRVKLVRNLDPPLADLVQAAFDATTDATFAEAIHKFIHTPPDELTDREKAEAIAEWKERHGRLLS